MSRYGKYTFSNSSLIGFMNVALTYSAASSPSFIASSSSGTLNLIMTESVSP